MKEKAKIIKKWFIARPNNVFWGVLIFAEIFAVLINLFTHSYYFDSYFFGDPKDSFMDYFNMLFLCGNDDPYYLSASYPAMCFIFLDIMYEFLPLKMEIDNGFSLRANYVAMLGFVIVLMICICIIYFMAQRCIGTKTNLVFALIFSGPILSAMQRGNLIVLAFTCMMLFFALFDSENKRSRYLAYIFLALSASMKIYPALFGLLVIRNKKYKEAIHCLIIGGVFFFAPFFAYGGMDSLYDMLHGLSSASILLTSQGVGQNYSLKNIGMIISAMIGVEFEISSYISIVITILLLVAAYFADIEWHSLFLIATACIWFPAFSFTYTLVFYIPAVLSFLRERGDKSSWGAVGLSLLISPVMLPYMAWVDDNLGYAVFSLKMSYSTLLLNIIIFWLTVSIIVHNIVSLKFKRGNKHSRNFPLI